MAKLYQTVNGELLLLYPHEHEILFQSKGPEGCSRPRQLCRDYLSAFDSTLHQGNLYYTYLDHQSFLKVASLKQSVPLFSGSSPVTAEPESALLRLISFQDNLYLLYAVNDTVENKYRFFCSLPLLSDNIPLQLHTQTSPLFYDFLQTENELFVFLHDGSQLCIWQAGSSSVILHPYEPSGDGLLREQLTGLENRIITLNQALQNEAAAKKELFSGLSREASAKEEALLLLTRKEEENKHLQAVIQSIKSQYEELQKVAESYQQEALKWYNHFLHS